MTDYERAENRRKYRAFVDAKEIATDGLKTKIEEIVGADLEPETMLEQINRYAAAMAELDSWVKYYEGLLNE